MYNIGNIALKWQPYPSEIYNTNVKIDINGITVKNNQTDGYTMITRKSSQVTQGLMEKWNVSLR